MDQSQRAYTAPEVAEFGSVEEITEQTNKNGFQEDQYTGLTGGEVVGSTSPAQ